MKKLFVGNMSFQTTESDLRALFGPFGTVISIRVMTDRETGQARGFAFVEMAEDAQAIKAVTELNGKELNGRALRVNEATPKPGGFRPSGGSGRGGSGSRRSGGRGRDDYDGAARQPREPRW